VHIYPNRDTTHMARPRSVRKNRTYLDLNIREHGFETDFNDDDLPDNVQELKDRFLKDRYRTLYELSFRDAEDWYSPSLRFMHTVATSLIYTISRHPDIESERENIEIDPDTDLTHLISSVPFIPGSKWVNRQWILLLWEKLLMHFRSDMIRYEGTVDMYMAERNEDLHVPGRIFFHLVENKDGLFPFAFMATYSPETEDGIRHTHLPLKYALEEYKDDSHRMIRLLSYLSKVSERSDFIANLMETGELFHPLGFTEEDAYTFLKEVELYESCGILCRIPNWWRRRIRSGLSINIGTETSMMGIDALLSFDPMISYEGQNLSLEEISELLRMSEGLAMLKGKWIEVNHSRLKSLLNDYESIRERYGDRISIADAFRLSAGMMESDDPDNTIGISNSEWLSNLVLDGREHKDIDIPDSFHGTLRPYQRRGVEWLSQLHTSGFGSCLADDMGLGKTAQMLAFLETCMHMDSRNLLVVPASLVSNWVKEIHKFVPDMDYAVHRKGSDPAPMNRLVIVTYGILVRSESLKEVEWDSVIIDEAQAIKNPSTKQTKAIHSLDARYRVALTGTPVENGLTDLWSIFNFVNPGLLGTNTEFDSFVGRMQSSNSGYDRLRRMISPFILRRMKTDRTIIDDLPNKLESDEYITLSKKQTVLYKQILKEFADALESSDPKARLGLILSTITKFKQVCNHPDHYLGQDGYDEKDSGKFGMLRQICESIRDNREKVLVFTQYKEIIDPLSKLLEDVFGRKGEIFHGSLTKKARSDAVERFNSQDNYVPYMVISLKAGGTGLNLTSANHVIHFDRWWNPAVEQQATDRAFRIGQTKDVMVHKFICENTLEERIDDIIKSKAKLASDVIGESESWISDMSDKEILDLFRMG